MASLVDLSRGPLASKSFSSHVSRLSSYSLSGVPSQTQATVRTRNASSARGYELSASISSRAVLRAEAVDETSSSGSVVAAPAEEKCFEVPPGGCPACGKAEKVGGCNGEGRIQGGIGAVPGFGWWPIKAFRPCPAFVESGGKYKRIGQSLEEVAFGRPAAGDDLDISERLTGR